ncbi:MAG: hypothetical protein KBS99_07220 [Prevotellaceae bacterium]|nr:hypothetical protein [Candidatus Colivivens caballi]
MKNKILFLLGLLLSTLVHAQVNTVQPSIMVTPFVPEGADIRKSLDVSNEKRQVIAQISGAFADKGFPTKDFYANYKSISQNAAFEDDVQTDLKSQIIQSSGADIFVEADISINHQSDGNSVRVVLKACEASTAKVLSSKIGDSGRFYTTDIGKLGAKAVEKAMDGFLATMQQSFEDIVVNGRSIVVNVSFDEISDFDTTSEVGESGDELRDVLEEWMEQNSFKNYYHIQGTTAKKMVFDDVRIPLKDPATGNNYNINKFSRSLANFFKGLGMSVDRDLNGGTLYIKVK